MLFLFFISTFSTNSTEIKPSSSPTPSAAGNRTPRPTMSPFPEESDETKEAKVPDPTEEVISADLIKNLEMGSITYIGFILIALILLLFIGWKFCYKSATNTGELQDDIEVHLNDGDIVDKDIMIEVDDQSDSDQKKPDNQENL
ncbi:hypothetical protein TVAG_329910 [Trichomonas vaginalis G3]|uniref:Uncharacterized protein n=1 Tax=Trichomonas vaginalis (strain ATCC PRA-98 / G3) TaxID=412133 RepID=A2FQT7_TRIV3|nr:uncharacterized protein TVAGG3_1087160 [Trichomonas vaginalis G3]EAX92730.1 hypothetical protein TVAG_329910 [Trichomonas vaginalis G3]KAI5482353.1 hypothetical protein TVAGG3_1087160 [Trichomonas vaginalis G3]|eukprot:XP_001305660.1 hypothetical protein [Trichomonas vaginalis G3]